MKYPIFNPMNTAFLNSLSTEERNTVMDLYNQYLEKEISRVHFLNRIREILGNEGVAMLFSKEADDIRPDQLHDVIQYAGVDLKEEQDYIVREAEFESASDEAYEDFRSSIESLLNIDLFAEFIGRILTSRGMNMTEEAYYTMFLVLRRRVTDFIERLIEVSKIRIEKERSGYNIDIINDVRRQLWCLEQHEQKEMDALRFRKEDDDGRKKMKKTVQEREDLIIKKRMSNTIALAALGGSQKLWMNADEMSGSKDNEAQLMSLYSPYDDKEHERKVKERTLTMRDFLFVIEHDKRYNKSIITIQQYFN